MLKEFFTYMNTPCPLYVRKMGYLYEAIALRERYRRNIDRWEMHLEKSRGFILSGIERCKRRGRVIIAGAGLLLDVPLPELSGEFMEVVLVDIVFLPEVKKQVKAFKNVRLVQGDLTGIAEILFRNAGQDFIQMPLPVPAIPEIDEKTDFVISLNVLSQLSIIPAVYALKKKSEINEDYLGSWCRKIMENHYIALKMLSCNVCMISDYLFIKKDRTGNIIERGSTLSGFLLPEPDYSWIWEIAGFGEDPASGSKELVVGAWQIR